MFNRLFNLTITRVALLVGALMAISLVALPVYNLAFAQESDAIEYAENGTGEVATFTAVDPEGAAIMSWSLNGSDMADFDIHGGVLTFKEPPDFEDPTDRENADPAATPTDNVYEVTVQATDGTRNVGMKAVKVEVTNVEEAGKVTLSARRPQSQVEFTATLADPDESIAGTTWKWAKASSMNGSYVDIEDATSRAYTPADKDIGSYLRATASYTDGEGSGKTARVASDYAVQGIVGGNRAPAFPDQDPDTADVQNDMATRTVAENTAAGQAIGDPVAAMDEDRDILTYTLDATGAASFDIDWATGQIMTKAALDFETTTSYTVMVRATDPAGVPQAGTAGEANSAEIEVTINVTEVNEPPAVAGDTAIMFAENGNIELALGGAAYTEDNPEDAVPSTWSLSGTDSGKFEIDGGTLTFGAQPDFEAPGDANRDNVYEVTVVAADADGNRGTRDVKVTVENADEAGMVTLSRTQPRVGVSVTANLTDPDGSVSGRTWQWYRGAGIALDTLPTPACEADDTDDCFIDGAIMDTYTPDAGDLGETLTAVVMYTDGEDDMTMKSAAGEADAVVAVDSRNKAPVFMDQDMQTAGVQNESTERKVRENTKALAADDAADDGPGDNIGSPVMAEDPDPNSDSLIYRLSGADAALFRVRATGQIEVGAGTMLNYEDKSTYMVTVTAEDSFGATASIMVTIMVTNVDEAPDLTGDEMPDYMENRTRPVATYTAMDPERAAIMSWSLSGSDMADFDIHGGVLTFKEPPDFEDPTDRENADPAATPTDNVYEVTVQATDGTRNVGMKAVKVEVTNVEEAGKVTLSARRPQSQVEFTATLTDPDGGETGTTWQWTKATTKSGSYSTIAGATSSMYAPADKDIGSYLRATASYTDGEGSGKTARVASDYTVERIVGGNRAPAFPDQDPDTADVQNDMATRTVAENTAAGQAIGDPVAAMDEDRDILTYTLDATGAASFDIDWATGQIMTKAALDFETTTSYTVMVRATDPAGVPQAGTAGEANSAEIEVTINVTEVNEPPAVAGDTAIMFAENGNIELALGGAAYTEDNPEDAVPSTWSLSGTDSGKFEIDGGTLTFGAQPDFEAPGDANRDNVYEVTVVAADADGNRGTRDVKVTVENADEAGMVTLSRTQPRVGVSVTANLTDPDGSVSGRTWQWYRGAGIALDTLPTPACEADDTDDCFIDGAIMDTYTPDAGDLGETLTAVVMYTDGEDDMTMKSAAGEADAVVAVDSRNKAPVFMDQDMQTAGVQNESTERKVRENTKALAGGADDADDDDADDGPGDNVGSPVMAEDPDPNSDPLIYRLSGADAALFRVRATGQIEVGAGTELDYEDKNTYMVTVTAEDSFGDSASIMVTIMVTNVDEAPEIMRGGLAIRGMSSVSRMEGSGTEVATYSASGPEADSTIWSLSGDDMDDFNISRRGGVLTFKMSPDYENPADMDGVNVYMVTVMADDGTYMDTHNVTVTVTNMDEMGRVTFWRDGADATDAAIIVGDMLTGLAEDPDGNPGDVPPITDMYPNITAATWQWARSMTPTMMDSWMDITGATNAAYTVMDDDDGYYLRATAMYEDGHGAGKMAYEMTASMVTAALTVDDVPGMVTLSPMTPVVGSELTAMLTDPDGTISGMTWQWASSDMVGGTYTDIAGATMASYTPVAADEGMYLRAMVMYTDGHGPGKTGMATTTSMVTTGDPVVIRFGGDDGMIDRVDVVAAIRAYLFGGGDLGTVTRGDVIEVIRVFLGSN